MQITDMSVLEGFHIHVYFDEETEEKAWALREEIDAKFDIDMGRFHRRPIGPHPMWSYQVAFKTEQFGELVPWMALNRNNLPVLVHALTGEDIPDHTDYAMWLGDSQVLNIDALR